jgi:hypothetical protein
MDRFQAEDISSGRNRSLRGLVSIALSDRGVDVTLAADTTVAVVGFGCLGLPLAMEYGKYLRTFGYDISEAKIEVYHWKIDPVGERSEQELHAILGDDEGQARVKAIPSAEYPTPARRPHNSALDSSKIRRQLGIALPDWHVGLALCTEDGPAKASLDR